GSCGASPSWACSLILLCDLPQIEPLSLQARLASGELKVKNWQSPQSHRAWRFQDMVVQLIQELKLLLQSQSEGWVLVQVVVAHREEPTLLEALAGVLKTVQQEYPKLRGQLIEVEQDAEEEELLAWLQESQRCPQEPHIRYRDGRRWVMQWQELLLVSDPPRRPWKEDGCYLITGGAGGLAQLFVQEMSEHVSSATAILLGRSALSGEQEARLQEAGRGRMRIDYQQADVSDRSAVHAIIQGALVRYGHLDGIIHAAGVLR